MHRGGHLRPREHALLAQRYVGAEGAEEGAEGQQQHPRLGRPQALRPWDVRGAMDERGEDVDDGGAEERPRDADGHRDVAQRQRERSARAEKRDDERRVVLFGGGSARDGGKGARQRRRDRGCEAADGVVQPLEGERVADEDRDAYSHEEV